MSGLASLEQAKMTFDALCNALSEEGWQYDKFEDDLRIECGANGDDFPMEITMRVEADSAIVALYSHLPFAIQEDKRLDAAVAVCAINNMLADGCFDYDVTSGHIFFRMTNSFVESTIGAEVFNYMIVVSFKIIEDFNDKLFMLSKGALSIEDFIASLKG